jgi:hypothetical protein
MTSSTEISTMMYVCRASYIFYALKTVDLLLARTMTVLLANHSTARSLFLFFVAIVLLSLFD